MSTQSDITSLFRNSDGAVGYSAGQVGFSQGDPGTTMYCVQDGSVELLVNGVTVETVGPGGIIGELALLDTGPRTSTAIAVVSSKLVEVDQARFTLMIRQTPFFAMDVMRLLARRLRATNLLISPE